MLAKFLWNVFVPICTSLKVHVSDGENLPTEPASKAITEL